MIIVVGMIGRDLISSGDSAADYWIRHLGPTDTTSVRRNAAHARLPSAGRLPPGPILRSVLRVLHSGSIIKSGRIGFSLLSSMLIRFASRGRDVRGSGKDPAAGHEGSPGSGADQGGSCWLRPRGGCSVEVSGGATVSSPAGIGAVQLPMPPEVLHILLGSAALRAVPPLPQLLCSPLEAALRTTRAGPRLGGGKDPLWFGYWLPCDGQLVGPTRAVCTGFNRRGADPIVEALAPGSGLEPTANVVLTPCPGRRAHPAGRPVGRFHTGVRVPRAREG